MTTKCWGPTTSSSDNNVTDTALFSTTAHALTTQREHELLVKVVKQIQYPQGTSSQPRPIQWGSVFTKYNQEVARQVQFKPRLGVNCTMRPSGNSSRHTRRSRTASM